MKTIAAISVFFLCVSVWSDGQAPITITGKGKSGIEVRDSSGNVTEVRGSSSLRLNQLPADAAAREETYRAKETERAEGIATRRAEQAAADAEAQKLADESAAAKAEAQVQAAAEAEEAEKLKEAHYPQKIRGKTVRGTRYVANPKMKSDAPAAPQGPVLSMTGDKKPEPEPTPDAANEGGESPEKP